MTIPEGQYEKLGLNLYRCENEIFSVYNVTTSNAVAAMDTKLNKIRREKPDSKLEVELKIYTPWATSGTRTTDFGAREQAEALGIDLKIVDEDLSQEEFQELTERIDNL
jgi:hypothetical protein